MQDQHEVQAVNLGNIPIAPQSLELWQAAEWLVASDPHLRQRGFAALTQHATARFSPLVCYLLVSLLDDPDLNLRAASVHVLAGIFARRNNQYLVPEAARQYVSDLLRRFSAEQVVHMLQVIGPGEFGESRAHPEALARLLDRTPDIGHQLARIATDRQQDHDVRLAAIRMVGELGLLEALPALKGMQNRIAGRRAGQLSMRFAPLADPATTDLLQALDETVRLVEETAWRAAPAGEATRAEGYSIV